MNIKIHKIKISKFKTLDKVLNYNFNNFYIKTYNNRLKIFTLINKNCF